MGLFGLGKKQEKKVAEPCCCGTASGQGCCCGNQGDASILVLGSGCKNCQTLEANVRAALAQMGDTTSQVGHITDFTEIARYGVMSTPGLVVDGKVVSAGKVLGPEEIQELLRKARG